MFYVYILYSNSRKKYYVGQTNSISDRLHRHNNGQVKSTKGGSPWLLVWSIDVVNRSESVVLEKKIKNLGAKRFLASIDNQ